MSNRVWFSKALSVRAGRASFLLAVVFLLNTHLRAPLYVLQFGRIENFGNEIVKTPSHGNRQRVKAYCARISE